MGKKHNKNKNVETNTKLDKINDRYLAPVITGVIVGVIMLVFNYVTDIVQGDHKLLKSLDTKVTLMQENIDGIHEDIDELQDNVDTLEDRMTSLESRVSKIEGRIEISHNNTDNYIKVKLLSSDFASVGSSNLLLKSSPGWKNTEVVAEDVQTKKKYTAQELTQKKILSPYKEEDDKGEICQVYFYGQYNKNYHWDGDCTINTYKGNKLIRIVDAKYDDGNLLKYEEVWGYTTEQEKKVWSISKRVTEGDINKGESWNYIRKNYYKNFNMKNVKATDIITVEKFKSQLDTKIEAYYSGNTSNGQYNDDTGKAYLAKYFNDGTIRTLYFCNFQNGYADDHTGNGWYIARSEDDPCYVYYKGNFTNGHPDETPYNKRENITNTEIKKLLRTEQYDCDIKLRAHGKTGE